MMLFSETEAAPKMSFEKQQQSTVQVHWLDNISGDFVTTHANMGVLRIWNASVQQPKSIVKVSPHSVLSCHPFSNDEMIL